MIRVKSKPFRISGSRSGIAKRSRVPEEEKRRGKRKGTLVEFLYEMVRPLILPRDKVIIYILNNKVN